MITKVFNDKIIKVGPYKGVKVKILKKKSLRFFLSVSGESGDVQLKSADFGKNGLFWYGSSKYGPN